MAQVTIVPDVYSTMVTEKVKGMIKISTLAKDLGDLSGNVGDTLQFPMFKALSDAELMKKGVAITPEELSQTSSGKKIVQYGKGVRVYDMDSLTALGNFVENGISQQARIMAHAQDNEMVKDIDANAILKVATAQPKAITDDELMAGFQMFGDEQDNVDFAGIVVNSLLAPSFYKMESFVKSTSTTATAQNGRVVNGCIGFYRGTIPVMLSDVNTFDSTLGECKSYIIKNDALGIMPKRDILVEPDRKPDFKATDVYADYIFACGLIMKDGVCILRKTIA
ncbi:hypothetical protein [Clostridium beijerinckii]|jgi:hypothetical protein|uniref:Phage major capsid protein n=2 Tax=Clostridium beijerinckii TaxID=1520 RepID=A0AAE2RXA5_CLOBE|nr:hypothetical protein [Clostridium beijerinckii]ABR33537.1 hypothetical protein Cbei_1357 [Clostridium beijerinckii NCIMB 8052]AIU01469.1 hypothetical protein Cbs_1357 [Clostridium beijerinckii ATCC 35702]MBF7811953.1 hypothetical protein [Clostridium beijerinckii]NRT25196.1 hypothetical protein [Clostridium beijerinckii]NRT67210.1 hypothetical protein [Clostridium beijerinckii]